MHIAFLFFCRVEGITFLSLIQYFWVPSRLYTRLSNSVSLGMWFLGMVYVSQNFLGIFFNGIPEPSLHPSPSSLCPRLSWYWTLTPSHLPVPQGISGVTWRHVSLLCHANEKKVLPGRDRKRGDLIFPSFKPWVSDHRLICMDNQGSVLKCLIITLDF